jgi:hypothetical protein
VERRASEELAELDGQWKERGERDHEKLKRMEAYGRSTLCRWRLRQLLAWLSLPNSR